MLNITIMVDEVTSHNQELMPLCIRFVDKECNIEQNNWGSHCFCDFLRPQPIGT